MMLISSGAANITPDDTPYADGEIVREGPVGDQGDGPYSAGRGGAGNIEAQDRPRSATPHDADVIPDTAARIEKVESHHVGRGGAGNESHVPKEKERNSFADVLAEKVKNILHRHK